MYEFKARNQITLWGPDGGRFFLMMVSFLLDIFFDIVSFCLLGQILDFAQINFVRKLGTEFNRSTKKFPTETTEYTLFR